MGGRDVFDRTVDGRFLQTFDAPACQEGDIVELCGWRTRSMFDHYNFIDEADLAAAVAKRFCNAKQRQTSRLARPP
jgi:hypothetical protein